MINIELLLTNGYNREDISELTTLFEKQIIDLLSKIDCLENNQISEEVHRLEGGCDLLYLDLHAEMLQQHKKANPDALSSIKNIQALKDILSDISLELHKIRMFVTFTEN